MKAVTIHVTGLVQGVFFRKHTKETAEQLGVKGTVQNRNDGSVYIVAEAEEDVLTSFLSWCKTGPPRAKVDHLDIHDCPLKNYSDFRILH